MSCSVPLVRSTWVGSSTRRYSPPPSASVRAGTPVRIGSSSTTMRAETALVSSTSARSASRTSSSRLTSVMDEPRRDHGGRLRIEQVVRDRRGAAVELAPRTRCEARRRMRDVAEVDVQELVRRQDRDELLHAVQERRVVHAGARLQAHEAIHVLHRDLLTRGDARALADHDADVHLLDRLVAPLLGQRDAMEQALHHAGRATHAEDPDVVARLVLATMLDERRGAQLGRELVGERGEVILVEPVPDLLGLTPHARRVEALECLFDRGHHGTLAVVASRLSLAVRAAAHRLSVY